jgi:2-polyprenyl-6-methoxyphenol hydroxylase-like FAD-dependent oxidoreductase
MDLNVLAPELPLCIGHPRACNLLNAEAERLGVNFLRGITRLAVTPGTPPRIKFTHKAENHDLSPRLVIGADGRNGIVAKQIGATLSHDVEHHLFSGMLVEDAQGWPDDLQVIACEGDVNVLAFPQGSGKVRIYLGWPSTDRGRLVGPDGPANFLDSWRIECVPNADAIANANPTNQSWRCPLPPASLGQKMYRIPLLSPPFWRKL